MKIKINNKSFEDKANMSKDTNDRFKTIIETSPNGIATVNKIGIVTFCNSTFLQLTGYSESEIVGKHVSKLPTIRKKDIPKYLRLLISAFKGSNPPETEFVYITKSKETRFGIAIISLVKKEGKIIELMLILKDITDEKNTKIVLRETERKFSDFIENTSDIIMRIRVYPELKMEYISPSVVKVLGYSQEENYKLGDFGLRVVHPEDKSVLDGMLKDKHDYKKPLILRFIHKKGNIIWLESIFTPIYNKKGQLEFLEGIARDITERKDAEEKLNKSEEKYRLLFENMIDGFALHEIILNKKGKPIDYVFLEVNPLFEQLTGLKPKNIIGKRVTDVLPGIEKDPADWIGRYGAVVLTGKEIRFEQYSENLDKWFSVIAFRNKENQFATVFEDVTARKSAEVKVKEAKTYLEKSLSSAPIGVFLLDKQGKFTYVNPAYLKILDYKQKDLVGKTLQEILPKVASAKTAKILKERAIRRLETGKPILEAEIELLTEKGKTVPISYSASGIKDDSGNIIGEVAFARDVTEQKKAEKTLIAERNKFKSLIDGLTAAGIGIDIVGQDHKIYYQNRLLEDTFGQLSGGELCYKKYKGFEKPCDECNIDKALKEKKPFSREEKGSDNKTYNVLSAPIPYYDGKVNKVIEVITDITEKRKTEEDLIEKSSHLQSLLDNSHDWIFMKNKDSEFILSNNTHREMLGVSHNEDIKGKTDFDFFTTSVAKKHYDLEQNIIKTGKTLLNREELIYSLPYKRKIWVSNSKVPLRDKNGEVNGIVGIARDITDRKEAEERLKVSYKKLKRTLNDTITTLASIVETRDPYTSGHQKRVAQLATSISEEIGLNSERIEATNISAIIHDLGKMNIPTSILAKPGKISDIEYKMIKTHPQLGYDVLKNIEFSWPVADIILQHHEKEDGSGYPNGLKGKDILTEAKILSVADVIEAMSSHRPYRPALGIDKALREIKKNKGKLYDPKIVDACMELFKNKKFKFKN